MEHVDTWSAAPNGERRSARLLAALAVSVLCHATVLLGVRGWRLEARPVPPLVVTMLERGGVDAQAGAGEGAAVGPQQAAVALPPGPVIAPPPPSRPVPARRPARAASPRAAVAVNPSHDTAAPADAALPTSATTVAAHGPDPTRPASGGDGATGAARAGSAGSGSGHGGSGGGTGTGSDGLRAYCASCPVPEYPGRARRQGWQGTVDVELAIGRDGVVAAARVGRSSGYPALDEVALGVARRSRFTVPSAGAELRGQLRYRFVLDETAARR